MFNSEPSSLTTRLCIGLIAYFSGAPAVAKHPLNQTPIAPIPVTQGGANCPRRVPASGFKARICSKGPALAPQKVGDNCHQATTRFIGEQSALRPSLGMLGIPLMHFRTLVTIVTKLSPGRRWRLSNAIFKCTFEFAVASSGGLGIKCI